MMTELSARNFLSQWPYDHGQYRDDDSTVQWRGVDRVAGHIRQREIHYIEELAAMDFETRVAALEAHFLRAPRHENPSPTPTRSRVRPQSASLARRAAEDNGSCVSSTDKPRRQRPQSAKNRSEISRTDQSSDRADWKGTPQQTASKWREMLVRGPDFKQPMLRQLELETYELLYKTLGRREHIDHQPPTRRRRRGKTTSNAGKPDELDKELACGSGLHLARSRKKRQQEHDREMMLGKGRPSSRRSEQEKSMSGREDKQVLQDKTRRRSKLLKKKTAQTKLQQTHPPAHQVVKQDKQPGEPRLRRPLSAYRTSRGPWIPSGSANSLTFRGVSSATTEVLATQDERIAQMLEAFQSHAKAHMKNVQKQLKKAQRSARTARSSEARYGEQIREYSPKIKNTGKCSRPASASRIISCASDGEHELGKQILRGNQENDHRQAYNSREPKLCVPEQDDLAAFPYRSSEPLSSELPVTLQLVIPPLKLPPDLWKCQQTDDTQDGNSALSKQSSRGPLNSGLRAAETVVSDATARADELDADKAFGEMKAEASQEWQMNDGESNQTTAPAPELGTQGTIEEGYLAEGLQDQASTELSAGDSDSSPVEMEHGFQTEETLSNTPGVNFDCVETGLLGSGTGDTSGVNDMTTHNEAEDAQSVSLHCVTRLHMEIPTEEIEFRLPEVRATQSCPMKKNESTDTTRVPTPGWNSPEVRTPVTNTESEISDVDPLSLAQNVDECSSIKAEVDDDVDSQNTVNISGNAMETASLEVFGGERSDSDMDANSALRKKYEPDNAVLSCSNFPDFHESKESVDVQDGSSEPDLKMQYGHAALLAGSNVLGQPRSRDSDESIQPLVVLCAITETTEEAQVENADSTDNDTIYQDDTLHPLETDLDNESEEHLSYLALSELLAPPVGDTSDFSLQTTCTIPTKEMGPSPVDIKVGSGESEAATANEGQHHGESTVHADVLDSPTVEEDVDHEQNRADDQKADFKPTSHQTQACETVNIIVLTQVQEQQGFELEGTNADTKSTPRSPEPKAPASGKSATPKKSNSVDRLGTDLPFQPSATTDKLTSIPLAAEVATSAAHSSKSDLVDDPVRLHQQELTRSFLKRISSRKVVESEATSVQPQVQVLTEPTEIAVDVDTRLEQNVKPVEECEHIDRDPVSLLETEHSLLNDCDSTVEKYPQVAEDPATTPGLATTPPTEKVDKTNVFVSFADGSSSTLTIVDTEVNLEDVVNTVAQAPRHEELRTPTNDNEEALLSATTDVEAPHINPNGKADEQYPAACKIQAQYRIFVRRRIILDQLRFMVAKQRRHERRKSRQKVKKAKTVDMGAYEEDERPPAVVVVSSMDSLTEAVQPVASTSVSSDIGDEVSSAAPLSKVPQVSEEEVKFRPRKGSCEYAFDFFDSMNEEVGQAASAGSVEGIADTGTNETRSIELDDLQVEGPEKDVGTAKAARSFTLLPVEPEVPQEVPTASNLLATACSDDIEEQPPKLVEDTVVAGDTTVRPQWERYVDSTTSKSFYYNRATNETQWTAPDKDRDHAAINSSRVAPTTEAAAEVTTTDAAVSLSGQSEPSTGTWQEYLDEATGQLYYYNSKTGECSWEAPAALGDSNGVVQSLQSVATAERAALGESPWIMHIDPASQVPYYVNVETLASTWERPDDYVAAAANTNATGLR